MKLLLVMLMTLSALTHAQEWTGEEKAALAASTAFLVMDWGQTRRIATERVIEDRWNGRVEGWRWTEHNPILGPHPSLGRVNMYFGSVIIGNYLVADSLKGEDRFGWLMGIGAFELATVLANKRVGISWKF